MTECKHQRIYARREFETYEQATCVLCGKIVERNNGTAKWSARS